MKIAAQSLFVIAAVGMFVAGSVMGGRTVVNAQSSAGNPVKLQTEPTTHTSPK